MCYGGQQLVRQANKVPIANQNPGGPAIQPRSISIPEFSKQNVRDYLCRRMPLLKIRQVDMPTISWIVFTIIGELDQASGGRRFDVNYPADIRICYVELGGDFRPKSHNVQS